MSFYSPNAPLGYDQLVFGLIVWLCWQARLVNGLLPVDLSQPWTLAGNYNQNELYCTLQASMGEHIVGYLVVQNGTIVAEAYNTAGIVSEFVPIYSATKSFTSLIVGLLVDAGRLQLNTTLGQIFADDSNWVDIVHANEKKTLTMQELLTFTAGLHETAEVSVAATQQRTLKGVLNATSFSGDQRGNFEYLPTNHILARIIHQVTGKTPLEVAMDAFTAMGLQANVNYTWDTFGGVEGSASGLGTNPRGLAKLGLLYLQQGYAAPDAPFPIVSPTWVSLSTTNQLQQGVIPNNNPLYSGYGYQWYTNNDGNYAAIGKGGQILTVFPKELIVVSVMTTFGKETLWSATLQSFMLMWNATSNFDAIAKDGTCVKDGAKTISPTTSNEGLETVQPTTTRKAPVPNGSAALPWFLLSRLLMVLIVALVGL